MLSDPDVEGVVINVREITERKINEEKINKLLSEKEMVLKEIHHRIKNNMNIIVSLLNLQARTYEDPVIKNILRDASSRVQSMGILYDKLYASEQISAVSLKIYFPALVREIAKVFSEANSVQMEIQVDDIVLDSKILTPLGIMINELMTNAMKYAFIGHTGGSIRLEAHREGNILALIFEDNGVGLPDAAISGTSSGFGLQLVRMLAEQINGTVSIEKNNGTRFLIRIRME